MGIVKQLQPEEKIQKLIHRLSINHYLPTTEWWLDLAKHFESSAMGIRQRIEDAETKAEKWIQERDQYNRTWYVVRDTDEELCEDDGRKPGRIWACDPYRWCDDIARRIDCSRRVVLEETDISQFPEFVDGFIHGMMEVQSTEIRWTAVSRYLEKVLRDVHDVNG